MGGENNFLLTLLQFKNRIGTKLSPHIVCSILEYVFGFRPVVQPSLTNSLYAQFVPHFSYRIFPANCVCCSCHNLENFEWNWCCCCLSNRISICKSFIIDRAADNCCFNSSYSRFDMVTVFSISQRKYLIVLTGYYSLKNYLQCIVNFATE